MTFQAYLDTIRSKTGKGPEEFEALAREAGIADYKAAMPWLKEQHGLGHGHANVIAQLIFKKDKLGKGQDEKLDELFAGAKVGWRAPYDAFAAQIRGFGPDVELSANRSYVNLQRSDKKFGIVQISSAKAIDIGIKSRRLAPGERLQPAGSWNAMVTLRVTVTDPAALDAQLLDWLRQAYSEA